MNKIKTRRIIQLAGVFLAALLSYQIYSINSESDPLSNYQDTFHCQPSVIHDPYTNEEIQSIVRDAITNGKKVMVGNRKFLSQIDAACAPDGEVQVTLKNMNKILNFDSNSMTINVQAGMRFNHLNDFLQEQGFAVNMVTELGIFTIGGMLGSGTHGSTLQKPSNMIADYVTAIKIIDGLGELRELTGQELNAARVNLGVLGIVTEVTIQLEPLFKVKAEVQSFDSDEDLEENIIDIAQNNYSANVAWFPGLGKYAMTLYNPVPIETPGNAYNAQAEVNSFEETFFSLLYGAQHEVSGSWLQCLVADIRFNSRKNSYFREIETGKTIADPVGYSNHMQYFECREPDKCVWNKLPIALQEVAIPLENLPAWIQDVRAILDKHPKTCFPLNGIYFRFGKSSPSYLGMTAGRDTAFMGIEYTLRKKGSKPPKNYFVNLEIEQMSIRKYNARPHWGKNSVAIFENIEAKYPLWNAFLETKQEMDPYDIFSNVFWKRLTGEISLDDYLTPQCSTRGECYCQSDEHCEDGERCTPGLHYTDATICRKY